MRNVILSFILILVPYGLLASDLGLGFIEVDKDSPLELFRQKNDKQRERYLQLPQKPVMDLFSALDYERDYKWFKPQAISVTLQKCLIKVTQVEDDWIQVETNLETKEKMWIDGHRHINIYSWEEILKKYCMVRANESENIKSEPTINSTTIQMTTLNDYFNVVEVTGDWIKIVTNRVWEHLAPNGRLENGWIKWKSDDQIKVKLYFDIDTGGNR